MTAHLPVLSYRASAPAGTLGVSLDLLMVGGLLLQAGSGGGKSRAIRQLLEETHGRVQHLVIDPEGEFPSLRERFDYIHAAPHGADAVATPKTARLLCRRLVEIGASAVLDIYDLKLEQKREFVRLFLEELMSVPRAMWKPILVIVDEADLFAPQQGESSASEAVIDLNARGRKRGFRLVLTTRRLSKLHKDAADLQNRMIGRTGLDLDIKRAGDELGMDKDGRQLLPRLEPGTFYVYGPAIAPTPQLVRTGAITTTHPEAGRLGTAAPPPPAKVRALIAQLADLPKEAEEEAKTLDDLRRENADIKRKLRAAERGGAVQTVADPKATGRAVADAVRPLQSQNVQLRRALEAAVKFIINVSTHNFDVAGVDKAELERAITAAVGKATQLVDQRLESRTRQIETLRQSAQKIAAQLKAALGDEEVVIAVDVAKNAPFTVTAPAPRAPTRTRVPREPRPSDGTVNRGEQKILDAMAELRAIGIDPPSRLQVSVVCGLNLTGGSGSTYVGRLVAAGFIEIPEQGKLALTDMGAAQAAPVDAPLTNDALQQRALDKLGAGERRILEYLISIYPESQSRADVGAAVGLNLTGGSGSTYVGKLMTLEFAEIPKVGQLRAGAVLYPEDRE